MDLNRSYKNANLEARRTRLIQANQCVALLRSRKTQTRSAADDVADAFAGAANRSARADAIVLAMNRTVPRLGGAQFTALRRVLDVVAAQSKMLDDDRNRVLRLNAFINIARVHADWLREPETWRCRTHNLDRQFAHFLRHLFAKYDVPAWMDEVWQIAPPQTGSGRTGWFVLLGRGGNLRKAEGLPIPLTKMMAHHALRAPADVSVDQALRFGQATATNVGPATVRAVLGSRLCHGFENAERESFWATVLAFFARHPMIDPEQIGPICDYLYDQKFARQNPVVVDGAFVRPGPPQPGLSMKDRDPAALVAQVRAWHRRLARERYQGPAHQVTWPPSGIAGLDRIEGTVGHQRRFLVTELLDGHALRIEGAAMKHCVATYAQSCSTGRTAIFSLQSDDGGGPTRLLTLEVNVRSRTIVQVRGRLNSGATGLGERIVRVWATQARLVVGTYALPRV